MPRVHPRLPYTRRLRLQRAIARYRRSRRARLTLVLGSTMTILVSMAVIFIASRSVGDDPAIKPLFKVARPAGDVEAMVSSFGAMVGQPDAAAAIDADADAEARGVKRFNGRPVRAVAQRRMLVTAYCPCARCCGKHADGITAAGYSVFTNGGKLVAADTRILPFGTLLSVPGYARQAVVPVLDTGKDIKGNRLDLLFSDHGAAKQWGRRWVTITIYDYAD